jgi:phage tail-like protein
VSRWGKDPHVSYLFVVELDGFEIAHFAEVSGLSAENEIVDIKEGGLNYLVHKFAMRTKFSDITLKRGYVNNPLLFHWFEVSAHATRTYRMNGSIIMLGRNGQEACRFNFYRAIPLKWEGPTFNAGSSAPAMQSLTIAVEEIELLLPGDQANPPEPPDPPEPKPPKPPPPPATLDGVEFDVNKAEIKPNPNPALDAWVAHLKANPTTPVFVTGHTSTTGTASHNKYLSTQRAQAVKNYLQQHGVTNPITAIGYGEEKLKVKTPDNVENQANRRCENWENTNPYESGNPWG